MQQPNLDLFLRLSVFENGFSEEENTSDAVYHCQKKLDELLRGQCSFSEYCDFLEYHNVDLDDYFDVLDFNLSPLE